MCACTALDRTSTTTVSGRGAALRRARPYWLRRRARHSCAPLNPVVQIQRCDRCSRCASEGRRGVCVHSQLPHTCAPFSCSPSDSPCCTLPPHNSQLMEREKQRHLKGGHWAPLAAAARRNGSSPLFRFVHSRPAVVAYRRSDHLAHQGGAGLERAAGLRLGGGGQGRA